MLKKTKQKWFIHFHYSKKNSSSDLTLDLHSGAPQSETSHCRAYIIKIGVPTFHAFTALWENVGEPIASLLLVTLQPSVDNNTVNLWPDAEEMSLPGNQSYVPKAHYSQR